ncbi:MAG: GWxTD domain-containing protein [Ignavibacteriae bacterium]|nr:GWxTD domain-containing protein [Ignavibacteriota bacterium]
MRHTALVAATILLFCSGQGQPQGMPQGRGDLSDEMPFFFYEAINLIASDSTQSRVDIQYRVDSQFFVNVKNTDKAFPHPFIRRGEVYLELLDNDGVSKARKIDRVEIGEQSTGNVTGPKTWYQGVASFVVAPGEYSITFEISDLESERKFLDRNRKVVAQNFSGDKLQASTPMFIVPFDKKGITPQMYGGNVLYGTGAALYVQLFSKKLSREPVRVEYAVSQQEIFLRDSKEFSSDTLHSVSLLPEASLSLAGTDTAPAYSLAPSDRATTGALIIPLDAEKWRLRPFTISLKLKQGTLETTLEQKFRMVWPDMPLSLRDVDFALDALRHITSEDERDSLQSGSKETRLQHLEEFWATKDPTPHTNYNEMMVEYYRRVDHATRAFSSMKSPDGYKSDRGRIYILHGPPTKSARTLDPNEGYNEVWTYEKLNKRFVFADRSKSGNYVLVSTQTL